jgi:hypothetical protein
MALKKTLELGSLLNRRSSSAFRLIYMKVWHDILREESVVRTLDNSKMG